MTMASSSAATEIGVPQLLKKGKSRNTNPGVRVVGGRIYDSYNGKTCHQCRQKTMDVMAPCKKLKVKGKPCPTTYCHTCLRNRYGEVADNVSQVADWHCPKCRGICNCSFCRKKQGHPPTGILAHTAKQHGFASVSELLLVKGPENFVYARAKGASTKKTLQIVEPKVASLGKPGKENSLDGNSDFPLNSRDEISSPKSKKHRVAEETSVKEDPTQDDEKASSDLSENYNLETKTKPSEQSFPILQKEIVLPEVPLPQGSCLTEVAGVELGPEDVGHALQFLTFYNAFEKEFDVKKGHAEAVIRELAKARRGCRSQSSLVIQFHIQLLSLIQDYVDERCPTLSPTDGENSWLLSLGGLVSKSPIMSKEFPPDCFGKGNEGYEELSITERLKLLTFLCDEALNTNELRDIIDGQNIEFDQRKKEAKARVAAAKDKVKELNRKSQDEIAKAQLAKNGVLLTIPEHEALTSEINMQISQAHAEMMEAKQMVPKELQRSDAVRMAPMFVDAKGQAFWRLKSYNSQEVILLQDLGECEMDSPSEKWFVYSEAQKPEVEYYVSETRKRTKVRKARKASQPSSSEKMEEPSSNEKMEEEPSPNEKMEEEPSPNEKMEEEPSPNEKMEEEPSPNEKMEESS